MQLRECEHAGDWYPKNPNELNHELSEYLHKAKKDDHKRRIKAIIAPHSALSFSGPTAAWAYQYVTPSDEYQRVFVLGPSHQKYFTGLALSIVDQLDTPMGYLSADKEVISQLKETNLFHCLDIDDDQAEHSIQMHLPFIIKTIGKQVKIVSIIAGEIDQEKAEQYGKLLSPYFEDQRTLFILSTDFCHWGEKYSYTRLDNSFKQIWQSTEAIDRQGLHLIEHHDEAGFKKYIIQTKNTICGKHVLQIYLQIIKYAKVHVKTKFVRYNQSQLVKTHNQSSISFGSAVSYESQHTKNL